MPRNKVFDTQDTLAEGLANVTYHWLNYVYACGNANIIEEHSLRYPLAEFFERKLKADVRLEQGFETIKSKIYDYIYKIPPTKEGKESAGCIEVKMLKDVTKNQSEINRFFADLMRLSIEKGDNNFFILFGDRKCLGPCFQYLGTTEDYKKMAETRFSGEDPQPYGIYSEWFALTPNTEKVFNTDKYEEQKKWFYGENYKYKNGEKIYIDNLTIQTKLMAVAPNFDSSSQVVYIWRVCKL